MKYCLSALTVAVLLAQPFASTITADDKLPGLFAKENLVAWCIVPFDARQRGPAERAAMLKRLGLKRVAYDWRQQHVSTFEDEIQQYQKNNLEFFAFWSWHDSLEPLIRRYGVRPQIWITAPGPEAKTRSDRIRLAAEQLLPLVQKTATLGCRLGLYNHGGWGGEPKNLVAVCDYLRQHHNAAHVGIVYNFHHGHDHISDFAEMLALMKPRLLCLNINGMDDADTVAGGQNKILTIGTGKHERAMLQTILNSGYSGRIGILDHRSQLDAEVSLKQNLDGLKQLAEKL